MSAPSSSKRRIAAICAAAAGAMLCLAFAAVPLYQLFCQVTGFGGATQVALRAPDRVLDREVEVRLDANVAAALPLEFRPEQISRKVRFGASSIAYYSVTNTSDRPVTATATYNVAPHKMGPYFQKLECFCFTEQVFAPGETRELAVIYYVDPAATEDWDTREVSRLTLSYTFHEASAPKTAALREAPQP